MKTTKTRAIVLRRTNFGEADRIVSLISPQGRFSVMAKGVRKLKSRLAGGVELFAVSEVVIGEGKGELGILTSARLIKFYNNILVDYDRMKFAYEALKQVASASENLDEADWFDVLLEVLMALDNSSINQKLTETWFYLHYAAILGRSLNLSRDTAGEILSSSEKYSYDVMENGFRKAANGEISSQNIKLLRLIDAKSLKTLAQVGGIEGVIDECLLVARAHAAI